MNKKEAHPNAIKLLKSHIYWNSSDTTLPFYSERPIGLMHEISNWDSIEGLYDELMNCLSKYEFHDFNFKSLDESELEEYNRSKCEDKYFGTHEDFLDFKEDMESDFEFPVEQEALFSILYSGEATGASSICIDEFIIEVVFTALMKKGELSQELFELGKLAIERELIEFSLLKFSEEEREERKEELSILLNDLKKIIK
jgi:hypothetical protein